MKKEEISIYMFCDINIGYHLFFNEYVLGVFWQCFSENFVDINGSIFNTYFNRIFKVGKEKY